MDKGLDCYEADFIDDSDNVRKKPKIATPSLSLRKKKIRKGITCINESEEESEEDMRVSTPTRRKSAKKRIFDSSSSEEEVQEEKVTPKKKKRRILKMDSDDDFDKSPPIR